MHSLVIGFVVKIILSSRNHGTNGVFLFFDDESGASDLIDTFKFVNYIGFSMLRPLQNEWFETKS